MLSDFVFQMNVWGCHTEGYDPLAFVWERPDWSYEKGHVWDHDAGWIKNFIINDQLAPEWHCLYYVAKKYLEELNG